ncbi:MAG: insulinase family protein, partial [Bacilli bacterium]
LYNMILGGGFNSKFMQIIREKNSLAYYINSSVLKADNILLIQSGISKENFKKVVSNIKKIMKNITKGDITEEELETVRTEYLSLLEEVNDNIDSILENYIATNLLNLDDFSVRKEKIKEVTVQDIINVSKKVHIDTIYLLEDGGNNNA